MEYIFKYITGPRKLMGKVKLKCSICNRRCRNNFMNNTKKGKQKSINPLPQICTKCTDEIFPYAKLTHSEFQILLNHDKVNLNILSETMK